MSAALLRPEAMPRRDNAGWVMHPDLDLLLEDGPVGADQSIDPAKLAASGYEAMYLHLEHDVSDQHPAYVDYFDHGHATSKGWQPTVPEGWRLVAIYETEDGPAAMLVRPLDLTASRAQMIFALDRAREHLVGMAQAMQDDHDYGAEFPASDAAAIRSAIALLATPTPEARIAELQAFKDYVHGRLDALAIPRDPPLPQAWPHRIGNRLDLVARHFSPAARLIIEERRRQIETEGWTQAHDDEHGDGALAQAAGCYALAHALEAQGQAKATVPAPWPWEAAWWKPTPQDPIRQLTKAGALIMAEIERLQRVALDKNGGPF